MSPSIRTAKSFKNKTKKLDNTHSDKNMEQQNSHTVSMGCKMKNPLGKSFANIHLLHDTEILL